jgi:pimeloyl-ACP methyl ester carboxylesterase
MLLFGTFPFGTFPIVARAEEVQSCHVGTYRLSNGTLVDIAPEDTKTLRWIQIDGETGALHRTAKGDWTSTSGWTDRGDGKVVSFSDCAEGRIQFAGVPGQRMVFDVRNVSFASHGVRLAGRLVMPAGEDTVPIVVLLHGSESTSALTSYSLQRMLPAQGVGAFVYDKRGTGKSGGRYSQDFSLLADDGVAAMRVARRLAGARAGRVGYQGGSQAGWVAPIAANRAPVDFVIVRFGLAVTVIDEDQEAVELQLREKGYSASDIAAALSVAGAAETVMSSGFTRGFGEFDTLRAKYRSASWYKDLEGDYTFFLMPYSAAKLRAMAPKFRWGTPFQYDPMPTLRADTVPQLWIIGGEDYEAPSAETRRRLDTLIGEGRPFTVAYYARAEHGMTLFENTPDGSRISTRYVAGYFRMIRDFAADGRLHGTYGDAEVTAPRD